MGCIARALFSHHLKKRGALNHEAHSQFPAHLPCVKKASTGVKHEIQKSLMCSEHQTPSHLVYANPAAAHISESQAAILRSKRKVFGRGGGHYLHHTKKDEIVKGEHKGVSTLYVTRQSVSEIPLIRGAAPGLFA